jgi:hypothetical protein
MEESVYHSLTHSHTLTHSHSRALSHTLSHEHSDTHTEGWWFAGAPEAEESVSQDEGGPDPGLKFELFLVWKRRIRLCQPGIQVTKMLIWSVPRRPQGRGKCLSR